MRKVDGGIKSIVINLKDESQLVMESQAKSRSADLCWEYGWEAPYEFNNIDDLFEFIERI
jgi:hypothetical protein